MHPSRLSLIVISLTALLPHGFAGSPTTRAAGTSSAAPTSRKLPVIHALAVRLTVASGVTAYPVCGARGFTEEPGDHDMGPVNGNMTLNDCRRACRDNGTCQAVSYAMVYFLCSFYSEPMKSDQLDRDKSSNFVHYDNACELNCSLET
jgi:hypothetical protein